jgi:biotin synthase-related radical SAM superfamily protein
MNAEMVNASSKDLPRWVRVSVGSSIILGLSTGKLDAAPTTAYLMTYIEGKCTANCSFCPQARFSRSKADMLSRVSWPVFQTSQALKGLDDAVGNCRTKRVCIQALNYPNVFTHLRALVKAVYQKTNVPISVSCQPLSREDIRLLADASAERIGIPLDAATEELFNKIKGPCVGGPYSWNRQLALLDDAVSVFGKGKVSTHFIVGLGETEKEMVNAIQRCTDKGILPALFAFTPIAGTALENIPPPSVQKYRQIQLARHLILHGLTKSEAMRFDEKGCLTDWGVEKHVLGQIIQTGEPFLTSGCPDCNRPYYNEKPSGPIYNHPKRLTDVELCEARKELGLIEA